MKTLWLVALFVGMAPALPASPPQGVFGLGAFLAQRAGGESNLYGTGGALEAAWHFQMGHPFEGRLRTGFLLMGPGSRKGRFDVPYEAHSEGLFVGWDFLYVPEGRAVIPFLGVGGCHFRYTYQHVPDNVATFAPGNPPIREARETTAAVGISGGLIVPLGTFVEVELRYTYLKHPVFVVLGPVAEGFLGDTLDPAPSHLALGIRYRF